MFEFSKPIIVSAHQPNFLPYLGFFDKMKNSDIFVIRDEVLFIEKDYHQRNRIRINGNDNLNNPQFKWLKVPVINVNNYILHIPIKKDFKEKKTLWNEKILVDLKAAYMGAKFFNDFFPAFEDIFDNSDEKLISLNMKIISLLKNAFEIKTKIIFASELNLKAEKYDSENKNDASEDLAEICKKLNADVYLSGEGGKNYLNLEKFKEKEIEVKFQEYKHLVYSQKYPGFLPNMSAIDALFCIGKFPSEKIQEKFLQYPKLSKSCVNRENKISVGQ